MLVIDKLSKVAHFLEVKSTNYAIEMAQIFIKGVVRLHDIPKKNISNRDAKFTSRFWKELFAGLGTKLAFSTTYHRQTNRQTEITNRILEDMLRMFIMHHPKKWEEYLPLIEFSDNNGYQESIKMSPFEALYRRSCNTLINWSDLVKMVLIGPDMLKEMEEQIHIIK